MKAIQLVNATIGTVSSREDGSVAFRVITAELRPSEKGIVMDFHGKACQVTIEPHEGAPDEVVTVNTEKGEKTPGQRLRGIIYIHWEQAGKEGDFETFYRQRMTSICDGYKTKNLEQ